MPRKSLYIDDGTKAMIKDAAEKEGRTIAQALRFMVALWNATTPVERAEILGRGKGG